MCDVVVFMEEDETGTVKQLSYLAVVLIDGATDETTLPLRP